MKAGRLLFVGALCLMGSVLAHAQGYVINHWTEDIDLKSDATFDVSETLDVTFNEDRHGIYRTIPIADQTPNGVAREVFLTGIRVTDEQGVAYTTKITTSGGEETIRVGDADRTFLPGTNKTYIIRYHVANAINWFPAGDWTPSAELYWNVNGTKWETTIGSMDVRVHFPNVQGGSGLRAKAFFGQYGSTAANTLLKPSSSSDPPTKTRMDLTESELRVTRNAEFQPGENLSIVLDVPETVVPQISRSRQILYFLWPNFGLFVPFVILGGMIIAWLRWGKDPGSGPMVVQFDPPDGLSGPACGAFIDQRIDPRDVTAGIISLAVKGYLRILPKETGLVFKKRTADLQVQKDAPGDDLTPFETLLYQRILVSGGIATELDLRSNVAPYLMQLKSQLYGELVTRGYYLMSPQTAQAVWAVLGIGVTVGLEFLAYAASPTHSPLPSIVGGVISVIIVLSYAHVMPRRTPAGAKAFARVKGFQEFIRRAKGKEIDWMTEKHPDEALFESYLPHAIAFGLAAEWAAAFQDILKTMPNWYAAPPGTPFTPIWFASDLTTVSNAMTSSAMTPPRSSGASGGFSGFGGGGFSGGGFGGGGGGSW